MDDTERRRFLSALSAVGLAGLAGCPARTGDGTLTATGTATTATSDATAGETTTETETVGPAVTEWEATFGSDDGNRIWNWSAGVDGGYLLAGETGENATESERNPLLVKVDDDGEEEWERVGDEEGWNWDFGLVTLSDGYVVAGGRERDPESDETHYQTVVREYDTGGTRRWKRTLGETDGNTQTAGLLSGVSDGYLAYSRAGLGADGIDAAVRKVADDGTEEWTGSFGTSAYDAFWRGRTVDDGYVLAGQYDGSEGYVLKMDDVGDEQWSYTASEDGDSRFEGLVDAGDGLLAVGSTGDPGRGWAVKLDAEGTELWSETYDDGEWLNDAVRGGEGYYLVGRSGDEDQDAWVVEIDAEDNLYTIEETADGGYLAVGWKTPEDAEERLGWALKVADPIAGLQE